MSKRIWVYRFMSKGRNGIKYQFRLRRARGGRVCGYFVRLFNPVTGSLQADYVYHPATQFAGKQPSFNWVLSNRPS